MINLLYLKNFKCFKDQHFELKNLTILIGLNGSGKSSVIQSLLLLRQSYQQRFLEDGRLLFNGDLIRLGTAQDVFCESGSGTDFGVQLDFSGTKSSWFFEYKTTEADVGKQISAKVPNTTYRNSLFGKKFHYLPADRIGPQSDFEISDYAVRELQQLGVKGEYTPHFLRVFGGHSLTDKRALPEPEATGTRLIDQVNAWMGQISPGVLINLEHYYPTIDRIDLRYSFVAGQEESRPFRSTNVGFGITYTLPIVVALLASEKDTLVLIENPEAHLHPRGQVKLAELMARAASCGVQIIVETHSDYILNEIQGASQRSPQIIASAKTRVHSLRRAPGQLVSECAPLDQNFFPDHGLGRAM